MYPMTEKEKATFYANVLAVASADGELDEISQIKLGNLKKQLKLTKKTVMLAEKTVFEAGWLPKPVGTFSHQVDNLETMVAVAMADDELTEKEVQLIATFANAIGLNQLQMDAIVSDVKERREEMPQHEVKPLETLRCYDIPKTGVALEFADSTSMRFQDILSKWNEAPVHQKCVRQNTTWYLAAWPNGTLEDLYPLALLLAPLRNKNVIIAGQNRSWWRTLGFARCAAKREKAFDPNEYCFGIDGDGRDPNPWGCREIVLAWSHASSWGQYGRWEERNGRWLWHFDKVEFQHAINESYRLVANCPHRIKGLPEAVLEVFPEWVDPFSDPDWTYQKAQEGKPGSVKVMIEGENIWVFGVSPQNPDLFQKLLDKAFERLNSTP